MGAGLTLHIPEDALWGGCRASMLRSAPACLTWPPAL